MTVYNCSENSGCTVKTLTYGPQASAWSTPPASPAVRCSQTLVNRQPPFSLNIPDAVTGCISQVKLTVYQPHPPSQNGPAQTVTCTIDGVSKSAPYRGVVGHGQCTDLVFNFSPPVSIQPIEFNGSSSSGGVGFAHMGCTITYYEVPIAEIKAIVGEDFDPIGLSAERLCEIHTALATCAPDYNIECLLALDIDEIQQALKERIIAEINTIVGFEFYHLQMVFSDLVYAYTTLTNLCDPSNYVVQGVVQCFEDPIAVKYREEGDGLLELYESRPADDDRPHYYFPGSVISSNQELRKEAVVSSFDLWTHYGYMLNLRPSGLTPVETLIGWVNRWEHGSLVPHDTTATQPTEVAAALQTFLMFDLIRNVNSDLDLGIPIFLQGYAEDQKEAAYNDYMNRLNTYLIVPNAIHVGLDNNDPAAEWLVIAMTEWSVLIHRPAVSDGDLRTGIEWRRLLLPLDRAVASERPFTFLEGYSSYNFYQDLGDGTVNVDTTTGMKQIIIPPDTGTWGGSEFENPALEAYYWNNGPVITLNTANGDPCSKTVVLYSAKYGTAANNSVYFFTDAQIGLANDLIAQGGTDIKGVICNWSG
jgi:hypothetical protein